MCKIKKHHFIDDKHLPGIVKSYLHASLALILACQCSVLAQSARSLTTQERQELAKCLGNIERATVVNLQVQSEVWVETKRSLTDPCEPWARTPICLNSTAWCDGAWLQGDPNGRARFDVHKEVLQWHDGASPYFEKSYSVGFDGKQGRIVEFGKNSTHQNRAFVTITSTPPRLLGMEVLRLATGAPMSSLYFKEQLAGGRMLASFAKAFCASNDKDKPEGGYIEWEDSPTKGRLVAFGVRQRWGHISWWLDQSCGLALARFEYANLTRDNDIFLTRVEVTRSQEVSPGIWWPIEAWRITKAPGTSQTISRTVYRASVVKIDSPDFDSSVFTVPLPVGCLVDDQTKGIRYYYYGQGQDLDQVRAAR